MVSAWRRFERSRQSRIGRPLRPAAASGPGALPPNRPNSDGDERAPQKLPPSLVARIRAVIPSRSSSFSNISLRALEIRQHFEGKSVILCLAQGQFKIRRRSRSRRGNEAEVFFAPKSAYLRRRLPFLNTPCRL